MSRFNTRIETNPAAPPATIQDDRLMTDKEAGAFAGQSARTIRRWRESGALPYYRFRGRVRIRISDLNDYIEQHRVDPSVKPQVSDLRSMLQQISNRVLPNTNTRNTR